MLNYIYKTFFILIILFSTYFFVELFFFKERILSIDKYESSKESNIVILTGGSNRIKDGLNIINKFDNTNNLHFKILVSGTGKGFTKLSLRIIILIIEPNIPPAPANINSFIYFLFSTKFRDAEFIQYLRPVGFGPSLKI